MTTTRKYQREVCPHSTPAFQGACKLCGGSGFVWPELRVLTLWQPFASLMAWGDKKIETRHGRFPWYVGWVAIHASATALKPNEIDTVNESYTQIAMAREHATPFNLVRGKILCVLRFTRQEATEVAVRDITPPEFEYGDYTAGRLAIHTASRRRLPEPIPWKGGQGLRKAPESLCRAIAEQLA